MSLATSPNSAYIATSAVVIYADFGRAIEGGAA